MSQTKTQLRTAPAIVLDRLGDKVTAMYAARRDPLSSQLVEAHPIPKDLHQAFVHAYEARWRWHYRFAEPERETVEQHLNSATNLIDRLGS